MELKIIIGLVLLTLAGSSYAIFVAYPFHKKRLEAASDEEERRYIRSTINLLVVKVVIMIATTIIFIFMWMFIKPNR
jgi:uncharacterized membrane protein required for colicin V production